MKAIHFFIIPLCFGLIRGHSRFRGRIPNGYQGQHPCPGGGHWEAIGHMSPGYTPQKNVFGQAFKAANTEWTRELCQQDSDGDGLTNGEELGDPNCTWRPGQGSASAEPKGHPGFCEPDRPKCDSGMTFAECPNPHAKAKSRIPTITVPPGANDHPQTNLAKKGRLGGHSGSTRGRPGFGTGSRSSSMDVFGRRDMTFGQPIPPMFPGRGFPSDSGDFGSSSQQSNQFDRPSSGSRFQDGRSFEPETFRPSRTSSQGATSGTSNQFGGENPFRGLSRDFGLSDSRFLGVRDFSDMESSRGRAGDPRFGASLDQRTIQGSGSSASRYPFSGSLSQGDIDRSVQARLSSERSRFTGGVRSTDQGSRATSGMGSAGGFGQSFTGGSSTQFQPPYIPMGEFPGAPQGIGAQSFTGPVIPAGPGISIDSFQGGIPMSGGPAMPGRPGMAQLAHNMIPGRHYPGF